MEVRRYHELFRKKFTKKIWDVRKKFTKKIWDVRKKFTKMFGKSSQKCLGCKKKVYKNVWKSSQKCLGCKKKVWKSLQKIIGEKNRLIFTFVIISSSYLHTQCSKNFCNTIYYKKMFL